MPKLIWACTEMYCIQLVHQKYSALTLFDVEASLDVTSLAKDITSNCPLLAAAVRLRMNNAPLIRLLYHTVGSSFAVSCQGSGQLMWTGPAGANITIDTSGAMYQTINDGALHFNSFSVNYSGMYTCTSSVGASESLLITSGKYIE